MKIWLRCLALASALLPGAGLHAAERIPAAPAQYFNDYAGVVSPAVAGDLNAQLANYERESSNQLLVAIFPKMESDSSVEDYTVRVAQAWKAGRQGTNNGAVLFAFMREHKLYIQVGYGLEATLTDALASQIIQNELKPAFRAGDYDGGLRAAVQAMIAATKGEYKGTGRTQAENQPSSSINPGAFLGIILVIWVAFVFARRGFIGSTVFMNPRRSGIGWINSGGSGGWSGGGGSSGGGGFSGGGGSFGGGGAGGSW